MDNPRAPKVRHPTESGGDSDETLVRCIIIGGAIFGTIIVVSLVYGLFFRGAWERDNRTQLMTLTSEAANFAATKQYERAGAKYDALFALLGDREITDQELKALIASARAANGDNRKALEAIYHARSEAERIKQIEQAVVIPPGPGLTRPNYAAMSDEQFIHQAAVETGFSETDIRESMAAAYLSSAKPKDRSEAIIVVLVSLKRERNRAAGKIPSSESDRRLDRIDADAAAWTRHMEAWVARRHAGERSAESDAEGLQLKREEDDIHQRYRNEVERGN